MSFICIATTIIFWISQEVLSQVILALFRDYRLTVAHPDTEKMKLLKGEGVVVGRLHVATLMKKMGIEAVEKAMTRYDRPDIFNTAQGSQFTSIDFSTGLKKAEIAISMDGKGAWRDNHRREIMGPSMIAIRSSVVERL